MMPKFGGEKVGDQDVAGEGGRGTHRQGNYSVLIPMSESGIHFVPERR